MLIARRSLLAASLAAAPCAAWARDLSQGVFTHGVASGDPTAHAVVLWTRFVGANDGRIAWEIAEDEAFQRISQRGELVASSVNDFCAKVDARGLSPDRRYFYRFLSASGPSLTGRTRTTPANGAESLTIALFSCSNFPFGYFHAYGHAAAREDIDLALHVGDYIYEYARDEYPSATEAVPGRILNPATELIHLNDYYQRYQTYHTDHDLLALRQAKPMAVVWDDHEISNDTWREGAQNHQPATEGPFADRVAAATKAYFDWMPIRRPDARGPRLYRTLDWGNLARILLLDTRLIGRDHQLDYRSTLLPRLAQGGADAQAAAANFRQSLSDPARTLMGAEQERWASTALADSKRRGQTWQIIAQQVVMGQQLTPPNAVNMLPATASDAARLYITAAAELGSLNMPWNMDSWDGYPSARARFLQACTAHANNTLVLSGDSHNTWLNNLPSANSGRLAAIEFAGGSVTSPGFERSLSGAQPGERETAMRAANPALAWCDLTHKGYGALRFTRGACESEWVSFDDIRSPTATAPTVSRISAAASANAGPGGWTV